MDLRLLFLSVVFLVAGLAGCLGDDEPTPGDDIGLVATPPLAAPLQLACADGSPPAEETATCAARLPDLDVASEPYVAVDPADGRRMALAVQTRTFAAEGVSANLWPVRVYVSDDSGASWRAAATPMVPTTTDHVVHADPVVAFGPGGVLYMSGLATSAGLGLVPDQGPNVYVARSDDLGTSWTDPVLLTNDADNDRQWIAVGPTGVVVATWQTILGDVMMQGAWSSDGGKTWTLLAPDVPDCNLVSRPLVGQDGYLVACSNYAESEGCATRLYRVRFAVGSPELAGCPASEGCGGTNYLTAARDRLVLACLGERLYESLDDGATWTFAGDLDTLAPEAAEGRGFMFWAEADAGGGVHLLLTSFAAAGAPGGTQQLSAAHVVLIPSEGWRLGSWTLLTAPGQASVGVQKGEFAGIGIGPGAGALAWIHADHQVRVARLVSPPAAI